MKHTIAISCSYQGNSEKLFKDLSACGVIHTSLIGRELVFQIRSEKLDEVKEKLSKLGVSNINILEWKKVAMTISSSGIGTDDDGILAVSLIPTAMGEGYRQLAVISEFEVDKKIIHSIRKAISNILREAGITDIIFTIRIMKRASEEKYVEAATIATLNALFDSGGVVSIE